MKSRIKSDRSAESLQVSRIGNRGRVLARSCTDIILNQISYRYR